MEGEMRGYQETSLGDLAKLIERAIKTYGDDMKVDLYNAAGDYIRAPVTVTPSMNDDESVELG